MTATSGNAPHAGTSAFLAELMTGGLEVGDFTSADADLAIAANPLYGTGNGRGGINLFAADNVVGGTSAGAAALTEIILAGGEPDETGNQIARHIGPGLGLLGFRAMIDTHFGARRRLHRLFGAIAANPEYLGLGIDENTALVVFGHLGAVIGTGGVTFVDGRGIRFDNADEVKEEGSLTLSYMRVGVVGNGYVLNLRERELETLVRGRLTAEETPSVKGDDVR